MKQDQAMQMTGGYLVNGDVVDIPLANLELGPNCRSQLRGMASLVHSVYRLGVVNPLLVEPHPTGLNKYIIFAGRRRYQAACIVARRIAKESNSDEPLAVQVGRYTVLCHIFRNLSDEQRMLLQAADNLERTNPSTADMAGEIGRIRKQFEEKMQRKVSLEGLLTFLKGEGQQLEAFRRSDLYRLLRIGDMDERVLEKARQCKASMSCLESLTRLQDPSVQIGLIESIQRENLTRKEVRTLVNELVSQADGRLDLPALIARFRSRGVRPLERKKLAVKRVTPDRQILASH